MKQLHVQIGLCLVLLTGCSPFDSLIKKVPFINDSDQNGAEQVDKEKKVDQENSQSEENNWTLEAGYFNQIEEVAGKSVIQNPLNVLALVNKQYALPEGYIPTDLIRPVVHFSYGNQDIEKSYLRKEAANALEQMFEQAKEVGINLNAVSGYRSYERQVVLFNEEVSRVGEELAVQAVAVPGNSEHQTGLAMDISSDSVNNELTEQFESAVEGQWLAAHAHEFGFILRYPRGKETITGYQYEPWHFRYVGKKSAEIIFEKNWTLEEYFNTVKKI